MDVRRALQLLLALPALVAACARAADPGRSPAPTGPDPTPRIVPQAADRRAIPQHAPAHALTLAAPAAAEVALAAEAAPAAGDRSQITSQGYATWIWPKPSAEGTFLGYVRFGDTIPLRDALPVNGPGCLGSFVPVAPRGWICLDRTTTLTPEARFIQVADATRGAAGPFPFRYAISDDAPMYTRVPTRAEQVRVEQKFGRAGQHPPLPKALSMHEDLAGLEPILATDPLPPFLEGGGVVGEDRFGLVRREIPSGSMLSFTRAFEAEGRTWLLSADLTLVPADRVRAFRPSTFHGTRLGNEVKLPIAWIRTRPRPHYRLAPDGGVRVTDGAFPLRSFVQLTGGRVEQGSRVYLETREKHPGGDLLYIAEADATVVEPRAALPPGVGEAQKWIHVRVTQGTLVAYEGLTPVYATLMSPGAGGVSMKGRDPVRDSTTPRGTYYVTFKDRATTMSHEKGDNRSFWIADVPHTQYFNPPFALHAAYWHERFGEPTSAGCINVSPIDAEALFEWSDPKVPEGWQGATGSGARENGPTTAIVVHR